MEIIDVNPENIGDEHICCAFSDKKSAGGYEAKKKWLTELYPKGYRFKKLDAKGKVLIEYAPAEYGWAPVDAPGYILINCFWISGKFKGQGYGKKLLQEAFKAGEDKNGVIIITTKKKMPYMSDKKFLLKQGFVVCDTAPPYFELLVKKNNPDAPDPVFAPSAKANISDIKEGMAVYYSVRCPFHEYYIETELAGLAEKAGMPITLVKMDTQEKAYNSPCASTIVSIFYNGEFVTHEFQTEKKFAKLLETIGV